ncbi:hypothetical protein PF005_g18317 [Phytophthora fragariae]|uniref:Uncharacterized protein n=1 Tax=Phytophthora fragariae TaxID=53985 RepID=A0A6A4EUA2_9STRA|nr:hypothetical protein PF003_g566 [Phytophthora fragariae]KAE8948470.1 hypothetical protein PF009_g1953 [Phytophthora fragariae]KAE8994068.1 hypothetical protein PF011_g16879 [Phytophthora fragariae]KAE9101141.1 hypothetical protein PF007_g15268 [Phytophthora fragariae]KAE9106400.1 hypothetical protein PF010_g12646 [Phytophthora fragariae]
MTVRSIVQMFESLAASANAEPSAHTLESPGHGNVYGLVTYYDALAVVEEPRVVLPTKTVRLVREQPATVDADKQGEQDEKEQGLEEEEVMEEEAVEEQEDTETGNQEMSEVPAVAAKPLRNCSLFMSKIPPPKSREFHVAAGSVRKHASDSAPRSRTSSTCSNDASQTLYMPPPTPVSLRVRAPCTSYAAFVSRIENSSSRLLDFEKDERWLEQVEGMKGRVEALKRRNHLALAREVASTPRKSRSMSECSGVSTASTASMSSMDMPEVSCQ